MRLRKLVHGVGIARPAIWGLTAVLALPAGADVVAVGPFTGEHSDNFNRFSSVQAVQALDVFSATGVLRNLSVDGAIKVEFSSSLGGDLVRPISGMMAGQLGVGSWEFDTPAVRFGGMWENNSGADDATVSFYDAAGELLGTQIADVPVAGGQWTWNGWESDVPFARVEVVGNGLISGFLWYENMQVTYVPEPGGAGLALLLVALAGVRRRWV